MRVLVTSTPGWGHLHPMVPLASALRDGGHEVLWATGADGCARLEPEGITTVACGLSGPAAAAAFDDRFPEFGALPPPERPDFMFPRLFGAVRAAPMLADLLPVAARWAPQVVVCDAAELAGHIAAAELGVPSVTHSFGALLPPARVEAAGGEVADLWSSRGLTPRPYGGSYDHLYLDIYPPSLQPATRPHVASTQHLRPSNFATAGDETLPDWITATSTSPLVYLTLGTVFASNAVLAAALDGLQALDVRVVATVGPDGDPEALGARPTNVHVARYIPQAQLLDHCAAVVSHGGSGTFLATLAAGLPQLCLPQAADQFLNADACTASGAGLALLPSAVSADAVAGAVQQLLTDDRFRRAAVGISAEIAAMPAPAEVAERLVAAARPERSEAIGDKLGEP